MRWASAGSTRVGGMGALCAVAVLGGLLLPPSVEAQRRGRRPAEDEAAAEQPTTDERLQEQQERMEALQRQLEEQQAAIEHQRQELEAQRRALEEQGMRVEAASEEDAQLQAILADVEGGGPRAEQVQAFEPSFEVYGFADMGLQRFWGSSLVEKSVRSNGLTFVMGSVNLYFDAEPVEDWRFLTEIRFSLLPDGSESILSGAARVDPIDSDVLDTTSPSLGFNEVRIGGIIMERAHMDYSFRDWLNVRVGYFLTPVGIWNVDHGTPTLISTTFPGFQVIQLFPENQLGLELFGSILTGSWELAYHAYISNGRTPGQLDLTDDKAFGGRLIARTRSPIPMQLGISGYVGQFEQGFKQAVFTPGGVTFDQIFTEAYNEQSFGADVSLDIEGLRIRAEFQTRRIRYEEGKRGDFNGQGPAADRQDYGAYLLAAYQLPWWGLEPFLFLDFLKWPTGVGQALIMPSAGLNVHFNPAVVLKFQYTYLEFFDIDDGLPPVPDSHLHLLLSRLAIAF